MGFVLEVEKWEKSWKLVGTETKEEEEEEEMTGFINREEAAMVSYLDNDVKYIWFD